MITKNWPNLYTPDMCTNQKELRKEAYRLWGLRGSKIIYDFPKRMSYSQSEFFFKFDFSQSNVSWPRAYALAVTNEQPLLRIIAPIIAINRYNKFQIESRAWYDMPLEMHEQIIKIANDTDVRRKLPMWQRALNLLLPKKRRFQAKVCMENYVYGVILHNGEAVVRVM